MNTLEQTGPGNAVSSLKAHRTSRLQAMWTGANLNWHGDQNIRTGRTLSNVSSQRDRDFRFKKRSGKSFVFRARRLDM